MNSPEYSVVVPVFQSHDSVRELVERVRAVFHRDIGASFEIVLVDDGSPSPTTWRICEDLASQYSEVLAIRLMRNFGKAPAVLCGLAHSSGQWIVTIDDDLQQKPEDIPALIRHREHDVVVAEFGRKRHGLPVRLASWVKSRFDRAVLGVPCKMSPLKLIKAEVATGMLAIRTAHPFIPALLAHVTSDFHAVPVGHAVSRHGGSRYTWATRFRQFSNLLISNSSLLLRMVGMLGTACAAGGFIFAATVVVRKLVGGAPILPGWASLVVINLVFGGVTLIALAIVGEYLIRIVHGVSHRPTFFIRSVVGHPPLSMDGGGNHPRGALDGAPASDDGSR